MSAPGVSSYLSRPMAPADPDVMAAIEDGPIRSDQALPLHDIDRLLDSAPLDAETGWARLDDGTAYVAVRTMMPGVSGEMIDWWFDWHQRDRVRYQIWYPGAHEDISFDPPAEPGAKPYWGATHYPVEDIGLGMQRIRIALKPPSELGFSADALDHPEVATIVGGVSGDPRLRIQHTVMVHVFLRGDGGLVLRSRFWIGAVIRPDLPGPLAALVGTALNRPAIRRRIVPKEVPLTLSRHCAIEYTQLASILPQLYRDHGSASLAA